MRTLTPRAASSLATTGPPPPAPITIASGASTSSDPLAVVGVAVRGAPEADPGPRRRRIQPAGRTVVPAPLRVQPAHREHEQRVDDVADVLPLLPRQRPEHRAPFVQAQLDERRARPDVRGVG